MSLIEQITAQRQEISASRADMTVKALKTEARVTFFEECATRGFAPLGPVTINHQPAQRAIYCRMRVAANPDRTPYKTTFQLGESA